MQRFIIYFKIVLILIGLVGCVKSKYNSKFNHNDVSMNELEEIGKKYSEEIESITTSRQDSLNMIIPQETHLFQLFKKGFKEFSMPIQGDYQGDYQGDSQRYPGWGFFPEIYNGFYQHLINSNDTIPFSVESDSIFWANIYEITGIVVHPLKSIKCIEKSNLEDSDLWFKLLKDGERDSLKDLLRKREEECFPSSYIYLGLMVIKNDKVIKIDTIHYGNLDSGYNCGKDGSFFEIPDSIYEMYCKKPQ